MMGGGAALASTDSGMRGALRRWLMVCLILVAAMVLIGGLTRLTESGLSIVKWKLVTGIVPPYSTALWQAEFAEYQTSPQYQQVNHAFTLADFQRIYWLEYLHRLLGRLVGMAIFIPFFWWVLRRRLTRRMVGRGALLALLVAAQGTVGWIMVASGLQDEPRVAPLKLALHLSLAFTLFLVMLWSYWQLDAHKVAAAASPSSCWGRGARVLFLLIFFQIILGALVAGLRAGLSYPTYPLMDGQFIPEGLWTLTPWWKNHLESILTVQFQHRMGALVVVATALVVALRWRGASPVQRTALRWLLAALTLQFTLGVATLLAGVPILLASAHQLGALLLLSAALRLVYVSTTA